eukprot:33172_1
MSPSRAANFLLSSSDSGKDISLGFVGRINAARPDDFLRSSWRAFFVSSISYGFGLV